MLASVLLLLSSIVWFLPLYLTQGKNKLPIKTILIAIFFGAFPCVLVILALQIPLSLGLNHLNLSLILTNLIDAFIIAAVVEELVKFVFAKLAIGKKQYSRSDYILIFGAVGLGYQLAESFMGLDDVFSSIIRGVFAFHVIWQYFMGMNYYEAKQTKSTFKKVVAIGIPILLHGANDFLAFMVGDTMILDTAQLDASGSWAVALFVFLLISIAFIFITVYKCFKVIKLESSDKNLKKRKERSLKELS